MPPPIKGWRVGLSALEKLYEKHFKGASNAPAISPRTAALLSIGYVIIYVVPFYLSSATRPSPQLTRNAPSVIRARIRAVTLSCLISLGLTSYVLHHSHVPLRDALKLLGFWSVSLVDSMRTLLLMAILFAGPLFEYGIVDGEWRDWIKFKGASDTIGSWIGYRNLVFGPANEELVWRSLIIPLHVLAHFSGKQIIFLTPLYFGIAHVHHIYEFRINHPHVSIIQAVLISLFQFAYTSLFGFFAAFVFLRTGNVYSCILAHSFCNWMGLPRFYGRVGIMEAGVPIGPPDADKKDDADQPSPVQQQASISWTVAYYIILVAGAVGFYWQLFPLTESAYALPVALIEE